MTATRRFPILIAIETDATDFHGDDAIRPRRLDQSNADQLLAHVATDLTSLFPDINRCALAMPGALYDQTEILRPGYPVFRALEKQLARNMIPGDFQPLRTSLGTSGRHLSDRALEPRSDVPLGMLLLLPLEVMAEQGLATTLAEAMEHQFLESGQLSAHSAKGLEAAFGIRVNHARFMTVTDLNAMLRMQLEHFGFLALWGLLDAAMHEEAGPLSFEGSRGQQFTWRDGAVHCQFETFDEWARTGRGKALAAGDRVLAAGYTEWTREYRQYATTLAAHGVPVRHEWQDHHGDALAQGFIIEKSRREPTAEAAQVTEHSAADTGPIAITVISEGCQFNYYPLSPKGLNALHQSIRESGLGAGGVAFPGYILYDEPSRRLVPETLEQADV